MSALEPPSSGTEAHRPTVENLRHALRGLQESAEAQTSSVVHILHDELGGLLVSAMMDLSWITAFRCGPRPGKTRACSSRARYGNRSQQKPDRVITPFDT